MKYNDLILCEVKGCLFNAIIYCTSDEHDITPNCPKECMKYKKPTDELGVK